MVWFGEWYYLAHAKAQRREGEEWWNGFFSPEEAQKARKTTAGNEFFCEFCDFLGLNGLVVLKI